ncbi:MAG TPA: hypothetical protein VEW95_03765 [Candidatus Limnocylindrales bacterium]|nr:hypothetical protein [Candidatus Limnocylindrales bacterium]
MPIAGIALLLVALLLPALPVNAASSIQIEARALVGGRYAVGGWMGISVTLVNDGEPTEGTLAATTEAGAVQRFVEMPAGARKVVMLYLQPEAFQRQVTVQYREPNGTVEVVVETRVLEQASSQFAIVGDGAGTLRPQLSAGDGVGTPAPLSLALADLPERSEPLEGLSAVVWADDSSALTEAQRRSIERWVANGGQLVIVGGADWQARTAGFADILPLDGITAVDDVPQTSVASWAGADNAAADAATISTGTLRDGARALIRADDGTILASMRPIGGGRVILLGADLATDAYRAWEGSPRLWARLLPTTGALEEFFGGFPPEDAQNAMGTALSNLPSLEVPPAELLLVVIVAYILLIGPISYVVLRRIDRRELAWVTAPLLVVVFTACSFGIGSSMKGSDVIVNQISLIRSSGAGGAATVESYAGVFSPERATYDLTVDDDALMAKLRTTGFDGTPRSASDVIIEQGDPAHLRGLAIGVFGFEAVRADAIVEREPVLATSWRTEGSSLIGTVTNEGTLPVQDVAYVSGSGGDMIAPELAPGESASFTVESTNFNGSSASDQVYGFGGFDSGSEAQRRILVRRQVIDALVGFGGFMRGVDIGSSAARGPYVVGWRNEPGPVPVVVDDLDAQYYTHTVEVVSVRPTLGPGEVEVGPAQMSVAVLSTEGDASNGGPGTVLLGEGMVTYSVALPLDATDMDVSELEILVGPDPSMVLGDQGQFGGFWPEGFTLEVRDPVSGTWSVLGDISQRSAFEIDDPGTAISDTGRIELRITGVEQDPNFGQVTVFVSARAAGVIGE